MPAIFRGWTGQMTIIRFLSGVLVLAAFSVTLADSLGLKSLQRPMSDLRPAAKIAVPGSPDWVGIGDSVWISNNPKNNVSKIDPRTNKIIATISVGKAPCAGLATGFSSVWVPNCGDGSVWRLDPLSQKRVASIATGVADTEGGITAGEGSIWIPSDATGILTRINPQTNQVVSRIHIPAGSYTAVDGEGSIWVTSTKNNLVSRIDPKSEKIVATIKVGPSPRFLAAGLGNIWVLNQGDGSVSRIDPATNRLTATIAVGVPGKGGDITTGDGSVWVTAIGTPLSRIDPSLNRVVRQYVGKGGDALRFGLGSLWLSNHEMQEVWRIDPKGL
jgi:virginiamycin B lyase